MKTRMAMKTAAALLAFGALSLWGANVSASVIIPDSYHGGSDLKERKNKDPILRGRDVIGNEPVASG
jgi:hypothetical protein